MAQTANSVRLVAPTFRKIRFRYSLTVPSVRCSSWAISLLSLALQIRFTTCRSRKLNVGLSGFLMSLGAAQLGQIRLPLSPRNSRPHRKQFRSCLNSIMVVTRFEAPSLIYESDPLVNIDIEHPSSPEVATSATS